MAFVNLMQRMVFDNNQYDQEVANIIYGMPFEYGNGQKVNVVAFLGRQEFEMNKTINLERFYCEILSQMRNKKQAFLDVLAGYGADLETREITTKKLCAMLVAMGFIMDETSAEAKYFTD